MYTSVRINVKRTNGMYLDLKTDIIGLDVFGPFFRPFSLEKLLQNGKKLNELIVQS
jgi:hypothetical protein